MRATGDLFDEIKARLESDMGEDQIVNDLRSDPNFEHLTVVDIRDAVKDVSARTVDTAGVVLTGTTFADFQEAVEPILSRQSRQDNMVLLEGERRPVRLDQDGTITRFRSKDEEIHFVIRQVQDAGFEHFREGKDGLAPAAPPMHHYKSLSAKPGYLAVIRNVVRTPCAFQSDWKLPAPGIDETNQRFGAFNPRPMRLFSVDEAVDVIEDLIGEIPFRTDADKANFLGACITCLVKDALAGCNTPAVSINAVQAESGKTICAKLIILALEPADHTVILPTTRDGRIVGTSAEELEKRIVAACRQHPKVILLDNADSWAGSDFIEGMLTGSTFEARILGTSETFRLPYVPFLLETKNRGTTRYKKSTLRRTVWITLEPTSPLTGRRFKRPNLEDDLTANTGGIRHLWQDALASLVHDWIKNGKVSYSGEQLNSFNRWSAVVGGVLENAGFLDFLRNRDYQLQFVDPEFEAQSALVEILWTLFLSEPFRAFDAFRNHSFIKTQLENRGLDIGELMCEPSTRSWGRLLSSLVAKVGFTATIRSEMNRDKVNSYTLQKNGGSNV